MPDIPLCDPIGFCIYCGSDGGGEPLGDEHVVPFSLGGYHYLPRASCRKHGQITSAFEGAVARHMFGDLCVGHQIQTRNPEKRPTTRKLRANYKDGSHQTVEFSISNTFGAIPGIRLLREAGMLRSPPVTVEESEEFQITMRHLDPTSKIEWQQYNAESFTRRWRVPLHEYLRLMAKIAHCLGTAVLGPDGFEPWLIPYIMGDNTSIWTVVGKCDKSEEPDHRVMHNLDWLVRPFEAFGNIFTADLRLFSQYGGPWVTVAVGKAGEDFFTQGQA